jgi:ABC-type transport system involved in multi-copper enzyme maturation permease subunit
MVLTLVRKELRETRIFAALALALYAIYLARQTGKWSFLPSRLLWWLPGMNADTPDVPFVQGNFSTTLFFIGAALAIALGFRQSAWEPSQGTALYLLHLPLSRRTMIVTKLFTGTGLLLACSLVPILIYAVWAATPGTHPGPFEWSMTVPAFEVWLLLPIVYLGAFASGIRPARWFGSRLFPLAAVVVIGTLLAMASAWWLIAVPLFLLATAVFISDILWEAETRDY